MFKNETQYDENVILARLPPAVRTKVLLAEYQHVFAQVPFLKYVRNDSMRVHLLRRMHAHVCHKGRQIIKEGDVANEITFMVSGRASVCKIIGTVVEKRAGTLRRVKRDEEEAMDAEAAGGPHAVVHGAGAESTPALSLQRKDSFDTTAVKAADGNNTPLSMRSAPRQSPGLNGAQSPGPGSSTKEQQRGSDLDGAGRPTQSPSVPASPAHSDKSPKGAAPRNGATRRSLFGRMIRMPSRLDGGGRTLFTDHQRLRARRRWALVRDNLALIAKMKPIDVDAFEKGRKIARIVIDNDGLGRLGYDNEQTQCEIEVIGDFLPGEFLGHQAMKRAARYTYSAVATEPCLFYTLRRNDVMLMLRDEPDIALELQRAMSYAIRQVTRPHSSLLLLLVFSMHIVCDGRMTLPVHVPAVLLSCVLCPG